MQGNHQQAPIETGTVSGDHALDDHLVRDRHLLLQLAGERGCLPALRRQWQTCVDVVFLQVGGDVFDWWPELLDGFRAQQVGHFDAVELHQRAVDLARRLADVGHGQGSEPCLGFTLVEQDVVGLRRRLVRDLKAKQRTLRDLSRFACLRGVRVVFWVVQIGRQHLGVCVSDNARGAFLAVSCHLITALSLASMGNLSRAPAIFAVPAAIRFTNTPLASCRVRLRFPAPCAVPGSQAGETAARSTAPLPVPSRHQSARHRRPDQGDAGSTA